ncbi:hypothetical protein TrCOL_g2308 [Triparma columacea]|uniref:Uncharacterized protein n=1 Tax=Triparma columacea TaxID=722753 RepID=A0A9W7G143_9STRA|nr:hypothetical protein TrCOL_g2308 [Triparma columacea]
MGRVKDMVGRGDIIGAENIVGIMEVGGKERWMAEGILNVGKGEFTEGGVCFSNIKNIDKVEAIADNAAELWRKVVRTVEVDWGVAGTVNMSLCALYCNNLPLSLSLLTSGLRENTERFLCHEVAFNLCTLYDLGEGGGKEKKEIVRKLAGEWGADIGQGAFRI